VRAVALHADVLVAISAVLRVNCVLVRDDSDQAGETPHAGAAQATRRERHSHGALSAPDPFFCFPFVGLVTARL